MLARVVSLVLLAISASHAHRRAPLLMARATRACSSSLAQSRVRAAPTMGSKANVVREMTVPVPASELYGLLADYSRYKDIWPGEYKSIKVLSSKRKSGGRTELSTVEFEHAAVMGYSMAYTLNVEGTSGKSVLWTLNSSKLILANKGGWKLTDLGNGTTKITYGCDVELKANVPGFVTNFVLGQAFPKMLKTFARSAEKEWAVIQEERRKRFERPLQAAAASLNSTIRSLEAAAESAALSAKTLANATVSDFSARVEESIRTVKSALLSANQAKQEVESPQLESLIADSVTQLDAAAASLVTLANSTVADLSATIDESLGALEAAAESAAETADELARTAAVQLADMQAGREPQPLGAAGSAGKAAAGSGGKQPAAGSAGKKAAGDAAEGAGASAPAASAEASAPSRPLAVQRALSAGWTALAEGTLTVLETVVPYTRPAESPKSKRKRLGKLLGFEWTLPAEKESDDDDSPTKDASAKHSDGSADK